MARIAGVDIPRDKQVSTSLTYIYGIGPSRSQEILSQAGIDPETRVKDRPGRSTTITVEGDLRREVAMNIKAVDRDWLLSRPAPRRACPLMGGARTRWSKEDGGRSWSSSWCEEVSLVGR